MSIRARYSGVCPECGERWQPGDLIRAEARTGSPGADDIWRHAACPIVPDAAAVRPGEASCPDCRLVHPKGGRMLRPMTGPLPLPLPTVPGKVHGIVSVDPPTVQCDGCCATFNPRREHDKRRLCRACAKAAGWKS